MLNLLSPELKSLWSMNNGWLSSQGSTIFNFLRQLPRLMCCLLDTQNNVQIPKQRSISVLSEEHANRAHLKHTEDHRLPAVITSTTPSPRSRYSLASRRLHSSLRTGPAFVEYPSLTILGISHSSTCLDSLYRGSGNSGSEALGRPHET